MTEEEKQEYLKKIEEKSQLVTDVTKASRIMTFVELIEQGYTPEESYQACLQVLHVNRQSS